MIRTATVLLLLLPLWACGGGGGGGPAAPTNLSYPAAPTFTVGTAITPLSPTVTGTVTAYSVSPALPAGLVLNSSSGVISGKPSAVAPKSTYTVMASNSGGSTTADIVLTVAAAAAAPMVSYPSLTYAFTVGTAATVAPVSAGGAVATWSVSPALPAGLTLDSTTGTITGTPSTATLPASYVVTAENSGGKFQIGLTLQVVSETLLDLGHARGITQLLFSGTRLLSQDAGLTVDQRSVSRCNLWNTATGTLIARAQCTGQIALAGPTAVIEGPVPAVNGLEVLASSTGALQATITTPFSWWGLASDGSYIVLGSASGLSVFSPSGQSLYTAAGNYAGANVYAAPGELLIALGPAGQSVIQTVSIPGGTSTIGPAFQGTFNEWFVDGSHFQTTVGTSVYTYNAASAQVELIALSTIADLGGEGNWFWNGDSLYAVGGSSSPVLTGVASQFVSGNTLGFFTTTAAGAPQLNIVDLSSATPVEQTYMLPAPMSSPTAYAAVSASDWYIGSSAGVILDGTSIAGPAKYLDYGQALSVAGGGGLTAVATASGSIVVMNAATGAVVISIPFLSGNVQLSADGTVLAASALSTQGFPSNSLAVYSLPSGTLINSFAYSQLGYTLSPTGTVIGLLISPGIGGAQESQEVIAVTGGPVLWSQSSSVPYALSSVQFSPDGTLIAASTGNPDLINSSQQAAITTNIYTNYNLTEAVSGWAVGWITNTELLTNTYEYSPQNSPFGLYTGAIIYSPSGTVVAKPALPQLTSLVPANSGGTEIFAPHLNSLYAVPSGSLVFGSGQVYAQSGFTGGLSGLTTFVSPYVVFAWGSLVVAVHD